MGLEEAPGDDRQDVELVESGDGPLERLVIHRLHEARRLVPHQSGGAEPGVWGRRCIRTILKEYNAILKGFWGHLKGL